jgi:hypothetical protein
LDGANCVFWDFSDRVSIPGQQDVFQSDLGEIIRQNLGETSINMEGETKNGLEAAK